MGSILLFSDVDDTLLDRHGRYAVTPGELASLSRRVTLVLASSRTVLELSRNQRDVGIAGPVIAENGAVVAFPWRESLQAVGVPQVIDGRPWCVMSLGVPAPVIRDDIREAALALGVAYVDQQAIEPRLDRRCSVLLRPAAGEDDASLAPLLETLRQRGLSVSSGGAWMAVTRGAEKGDGAFEVRSALERLGERYALVAAVGDSDNDVSLLLAADRRFVIGRDDGTWHPALRALPDVECVSTPGIAGWREVMRQLDALQED